MKSKLILILAMLGMVAAFAACTDEPVEDTDVVIEEPLEATADDPVIEEEMTEDEMGGEEMMTGEDPTAEDLEVEEVPDPDSDY